MKRLAWMVPALLLAACGETTRPGASVVVVSASKGAVQLPADSSSAATTFTFTNKAGSREVTVGDATLSWRAPGTNAPQSAVVDLPELTLPAGVTCPAASTNPAATCTLSTPGASFADRSLTRTLADADLFAPVLAAVPGASKLPVTVQFGGASNPLSFTVTVSAGAGNTAPTPPQAPRPVVTVNTAGSAPYSGTVSVTVAGNFDALSKVERLILEVTDARGNVDNTSYVSANATATFSVDTARYPRALAKVVG